MSDRPVLSGHRLKALAGLSHRLLALLERLDTVDRHAPAAPDLKRPAAALFAEARRRLGETAFQPLPRRRELVPFDLLVTALSAIAAVNQLLRQSNFGPIRSRARIYPRASPDD